MFKVYEYCLLPYLKKNLKISPRQFAYRSDVGCITAATLLKETVSKYVKEDSLVHCCMVDFSGAYVKLNTRILISKLSKTDLPPLIVLTMKSIFENSYVGIRFSGTSSEEDFEVRNGVRQGGICSGLLFTFYADEIINTLSEMPQGCRLDFVKICSLGYADDLTVMAPSANGLQFLIDKLYLIANYLCLSINMNKTIYIVFGKKNRLDVEFKVYIGGNLLRRVKNHKYLGVVFCDDLSIKNDIDRGYKSFLAQFNSMYYKFSFLDRDQRLFLFNSFCKSFYGCELWYSSLERTRLFDGLSTAYHSGVKRILGLSKWHNNHLAARLSNMPLFKHLLSEKMVSFLLSLVQNSSPCVYPLRQYLKNKSVFSQSVQKLFLDTYSINNLFDQPLCAIKSRIRYVQNHEESSGFIPMFLYN